MNAPSLTVAVFLAGAIVLVLGCSSSAQSISNNWLQISAVPDAKTHVVPRTWPLDKYPDTPTLKPHAKVTVLDQKGPGVVTFFHVSDYARGDASKLVLRVWYDGLEKPAIEMPLMDFLGDIQGATKPYHTIYFSRVRASHNFRLPMPFREHIRIEIENPTDADLLGYMEVQWDAVPSIPKECGYLRVAYMAGQFQFPHEDLVLCDIRSPGTIVAHWLQLEGDDPACAGGQGTCEATMRYTWTATKSQLASASGLRISTAIHGGFRASNRTAIARLSATSGPAKVAPWPQRSAPATRTRSASGSPA